MDNLKEYKSLIDFCVKKQNFSLFFKSIHHIGDRLNKEIKNSPKQKNDIRDNRNILETKGLILWNYIWEKEVVYNSCI
ncbi:MAG: hypothetical protein LBL16_00215 [Endomicrobium sp.]|jgi:hypothetical protein|nr:hypothetical protein [Endomicrobium sp.]